MAPVILTEREKFGHWLSGFTDGEGSFNLSCTGKVGRSSFSIKLRADELPILRSIQAYLGGIGFVGVQPPRKGVINPIAEVTVCGIHDLAEVIVPHFRQYPLRAKKARDFMTWAKAVDLHCAIAQRPILYRSAPFKGSFPQWHPRDTYSYRLYIDILRRHRQFQMDIPAPGPFIFDEAGCHWLAGLIAAEGCLSLRLGNKGKTPQARFSLKLRADDSATVRAIAAFFGGGYIGYVESKVSHPTLDYQTTSSDVVAHRVIPFLDTYPLRAKKQAEVSIWKEAIILCGEVSRRRPQGQPYVNGRCVGHLSRWTTAEREHFLHLRNELNRLRICPVINV